MTTRNYVGVSENWKAMAEEIQESWRALLPAQRILQVKALPEDNFELKASR
jgi:hypothetical protein